MEWRAAKILEQSMVSPAYGKFINKELSLDNYIRSIKQGIKEGSVTSEEGRKYIRYAKDDFEFIPPEYHVIEETAPPLNRVFERGFPISHHDALSISNKLGEPSGVSLSMLPSKARSFSADEFVHRVLPLFGGSPQERVVNLMTPEGRRMLNDAMMWWLTRCYQEIRST